MDERDSLKYRTQLNRFFISQLLLNRAVWQLPRAVPGVDIQAPYNSITGQFYRGASAMRLLAAQHILKRSDSRWLSEDEVREHGLMPRTSAFGPLIQIKTEDQWRLVRVFNGDDLIGLEPLQPRVSLNIRPVEIVRPFAEVLGITQASSASGGFGYSHSENSIQIPELVSGRTTPEGEASAVLNLIKAIDASMRPELAKPGQSTNEALQAEARLRTNLAALFVSSRLGLPFYPDDSRNDSKTLGDIVETDAAFVTRSAGHADQIASRFISIAHELTVDKNQEQKRIISLPKGGAISESDRRYLFVPSDDYAAAKAAGTFWDRDKKMHFIHVETDIAAFSRWKEAPRALGPDEIKNQFRLACMSFGLNMDHSSAEIEMDGTWRGVPVTTSSNKSKKSGRYLLNADGRGQIMNIDSGESGPWRPDGPIATDPVTQQRFEEARKNQERVQAAEVKKQQAAESRCTERWTQLPAIDSHPYTLRKLIPATGLKKWGNDLAISMYDVDGVVRNIQRISPDSGGPKLYQTGARKLGLHHVLGNLETATTVFFVEGYATGRSVHMATGIATVVCFDSSNIEHVMKALSDKTQKADRIICADNDLVTAQRAARSLNGAMRDKFGYPIVDASDISNALSGTGGWGEGRFQLRVKELKDSSHYDMPRLYCEVWKNESKVHQLMVNNAGMEKALAAAALGSAKVIHPSFNDPAAYENGWKDFNDLHAQEGIDSVSQQLALIVDLIKGREYAKERARELKYNLIEIIPHENDARHIGNIVGHAGCHALQDIGKNEAVAHSYKYLDQIPKADQMTRIEYKDGRGSVTPVLKRNMERGNTR